MAGHEFERRLTDALDSGDATDLRHHLTRHSGLPGPRLDLRLVADFADAVASMVARPDPPADGIAELLDGWAALPVEEARVDRPEVVLPCAAVLAYGAVGAARPDWWEHELAKVRRAASDPRWRVREIVAMALQRFLAADWDRTVDSLQRWARDDDPLVVRAAAAGIAEPRLLDRPGRRADSLAIQWLAIEALRSQPSERRRSDGVLALRKGLAFSVSVAVAATGDFGPLEAMAASGDADLVWAARENLKKSRLGPWSSEVDRVRALL